MGSECQLPILKNFRIGIWLPDIICQFTKTDELATNCLFVGCLFSYNILKPFQIELASDCQLPDANSPGLTNLQLGDFCRLPNHLLFSTIASNRIGIWLPATRCQFARTDEFATSCLIPVAYSTVILYNCLKPNWHLTASCHWPINKNLRIGIWLPFANCLFRCCALNPSQFELASGCQLRCQFTRICELAIGCRLQVAFTALIAINPFKSYWQLAAS